MGKAILKTLSVLLFFGGIMSAQLPNARSQTGYDQTGGFLLTGPNGLKVHGAFQFHDFWTPNPEPGLLAHYQFKLVLEKPDALKGLPPDILYTLAASAWGDEHGHYFWQCGDWKLEMIGIDETFRQQVSWESASAGHQPQAMGDQQVNITIGIDTMLITCKRFQ